MPLPPAVDLPPRPPAPSPAAAAAAEIVGFELPPVETVVGAVQDATDTLHRLVAQIRAVLGGGIATADAIQGRLSAGTVAGLRAAIDAGNALCQGVHSCVVANTLAAIATVDQWLTTLPLPEEAHQAILMELAAIFGGEPPTAGSEKPIGGSLGEDAGGSPDQQCPAGWVWDPFHQVCRYVGDGQPPDTHPCPPGWVWDEQLGKCVGTLRLPPGRKLPPGGGGVLPIDCPPGHSLVSPDAARQFVAAGRFTAAQCKSYVYSCKGVERIDQGITPDWKFGDGAIDQDGKTYPPPGPYHYHEWDGQTSLHPCSWSVLVCVPSGGGPPPPPPPPVTLPPSGGPCPCVTCKCDPCVCPKPPAGSTYCGPGTHWDDSSGKCVPDKPKPRPQKCPKGQHWDSDSQQCVDDDLTQYCVYCSAENGDTYLASPGEGPASPDDFVLECYPDFADVPPKDEWPQCPQPPEIEQEAGVVPFPVGGPWCSLDICSLVLDPAGPPAWSGNLWGPILNALSGIGGGLDAQKLADQLPLLVRPFAAFFFSIVGGLMENIRSVIVSWVATTGCVNLGTAPSLVISTVLGFLQRWGGLPADELDIGNRYYRHLICPQLTLTAEQATAAYLADELSIDQLRCIVQSNNQCWEPWQALLQGARTKLGVQELLQLRRRGEIDAGEYALKMRELGYTDSDDPQQIYKLTTQIPFVSDLLRMMVRDVADLKLVTLFGMDDQFSDKWVGQLSDWGEQQGVEELYARYVWRAHWSIPSPTQLYEIYHRLRDTQPPAGFADWKDVIRTALVQQDILPFWVDPLMDVAFHPLNATDLVRAFSVGSIGIDEVEAGYRQLGYSDENAAAITRFRVRERIEQARTLPQTKLYMDDGFSRGQFENYLFTRNYDNASIDQIVSQADERKDAALRKTCISSNKKRYMKGELSYDQLVAALIGVGVEQVESIRIANRAQCEFAARDPHVPLRYLISLYKRGIINAAEFRVRCGNLGILPDLAAKIRQQADAELGDKQAAAEAKKLRQQERALEQAARAAARIAKAAARAAEKEQAAADRARKQREAARKLLDVAIKECVKSGGDESICTQQINQAITDIQSQYGLSIQESVAIVTLASDTTPKPWTSAGWEAALAAALEEHLAASTHPN